MSKVVGTSVGILVFDHQNRLLLGRRLSNHGGEQGSWAIPGGMVEFGETVEAAARRELMEEAGITLEAITFAGYSNNIFTDGQTHTVSLYFRGNIPFNQQPRACEPHKCAQWLWFALDDLPRPLFLPLQNLLNNYNILS